MDSSSNSCSCVVAAANSSLCHSCIPAIMTLLAVLLNIQTLLALDTLFTPAVHHGRFPNSGIWIKPRIIVCPRHLSATLMDEMLVVTAPKTSLFYYDHTGCCRGAPFLERAFNPSSELKRDYSWALEPRYCLSSHSISCCQTHDSCRIKAQPTYTSNQNTSAARLEKEHGISNDRFKNDYAELLHILFLNPQYMKRQSTKLS